MNRKDLPNSYYNFVSMLGAGLALFGAAAIIILFILDKIRAESSPYIGIFIFMALPAVLVSGLVLVPIGMWFEQRRRKRGKPTNLIINFGRKSHRNAFIIFATGTSIFLLLTTVGMYGAYEYTESVEFCGEVCHQVMEPEFVAYHNSAHAQVGCAKCHIGPGADWYVKSKMSGARQVVKAIQGTYPRPIPTPVHNLRPAREVCEQCHWPGQFFSSKAETWNYFLGDKENTHWQVRALMHIGGVAHDGEPTGSHWHVDPSNRMTYVAVDDEREEFAEISFIEDGETVVYSRNGRALPDSVRVSKEAEGLVREMDCMDCHNRPAHGYSSPLHAVNRGLMSGAIDRDLPWIKRKAVELLAANYATKEGAQDSIRIGLTNFYEERGVALTEGTVEAVQDIYENNFFPQMQVRWDEYPDFSGHLLFDGCFRCHGSSLRTVDGRTISADCNVCHSIMAQGEAPLTTSTVSLSGLEFQHPFDIEGAEREMLCTDCHTGDESIYDDREEIGSVVPSNPETQLGSVPRTDPEAES